MNNEKNKKISQMKHLCEFLHSASMHYYKYDAPVISDKKYDDLLDELAHLEEEIGIIMNDSPTQRVQGEVLEKLNKVTHSKPMLSADKTKEMSEIKKFIADKPVVVSWKLDGLTIVLRYKNGRFVQAITRGNGKVGEDVTHTIRHCVNVPLQLNKNVSIEIRGEAVISLDDFKKLNAFGGYSHPRNVAAGSVRLLNTDVAKERHVKFIAFELNQEYRSSKAYDTEDCYFSSIAESFQFLESCGFDVVPYMVCDKHTIDFTFKLFEPDKYEYPVDGLIVKYDDYEYGHSLGVTAHHPLNMMAFKWSDEVYETILRDVEWATSKSGLINPVAIFDEVDLDGALTTRATLHNLTYIKNLKLGIGDRITVYRSNMVIPKIHENLDQSNTLAIPTKCPTCHSPAVLLNENGSETLHCFNNNCPAQKLSLFVHFVSREGVNIDGLSKARLEKLISLGWINKFVDIYHLGKYKDKMSKLNGFGVKSVNKLIENIEKSRQINLEHFLTSLSIPLLGKSNCKAISIKNHMNIYELLENIKSGFDWTEIDGFGNAKAESLTRYFDSNLEMIKELILEFNFIVDDEEKSNLLQDMIFVITGKVHIFKNRNEIKKIIEDHGGKVTNMVTSKTSYLINNDVHSSSTKNKKAKQLGIGIISESDLIKMIS